MYSIAQTLQGKLKKGKKLSEEKTKSVPIPNIYLHL